ncbi:unnamed protein product [Scytosiphon promiscuus]
MKAREGGRGGRIGRGVTETALRKRRIPSCGVFWCGRRGKASTGCVDSSQAHARTRSPSREADGSALCISAREGKEQFKTKSPLQAVATAKRSRLTASIPLIK